jgi:hypothetical protein
VIARDRDPAALTAGERLAEIAEILAIGYLRARTARIQSEKGLAGARGSEAQCGSKALNPKSEDHAA